MEAKGGYDGFDEVFSEIMAEHARTNPEANNLFSRLREENGERRLVLYGAGGNCEFALYVCDIYNIPVTCICDSRETGRYEHKNGKVYDIISPQTLLAEYADAFVLITTWRFEEEISDYLAKIGFPVKQTFHTRNPVLMRPEIFIDKYLKGYRWAYGLYADQNSRRKIVERIRFFLLGEHIQANSQFFGGQSYFGFPEWSIGRNEVFVDGGGYTGDTTLDFIHHAGDYSRIHFFEPDVEISEKAARNLAGYKNIDMFRKGLWSKETELTFYSALRDSHKMGGYFRENAELQDWKYATTVLPVTGLDAHFANSRDGELPSLIKLDIEGAENEALKGAADIIARNKPKLAISIYHKPDDMYELPRTIMEIRNDYRLRLWQLGDGYWDLVLYAY